MRPYKRLFTEVNRKVKNISQAKQIVDISRLQFIRISDTLTWIEATNKVPFGYRLPTIQELYTAYVQGNNVFNGRSYLEFCSNSPYYGEGYDWTVWTIDREGNIDFKDRLSPFHIVYVKKVK